MYLENAYKLLKNNGEIYLDTDNLNEISMQFQNVKFQEFFIELLIFGTLTQRL